MSQHFDVVVLGASLGSLAAASLLARRGFRVLVLGHNDRPPTYNYEGHVLFRRVSQSAVFGSPAWARVLAELAQLQPMRRRLTALDPMFQVLSPGMRLDAWRDGSRFLQVFERAHRDLGDAVATLYGRLSELNEATDKLLDDDIVIPPGTFWERQRAASWQKLPFAAEQSPCAIAGIASRHPFAVGFEAVSRTLGYAWPSSALGLARVHALATRGPMALPGGDRAWTQFFVERIEAHGGLVHEGKRAHRIVTAHGRVTGVVVDEESAVSCDFVVTSLAAAAAMALAGIAHPASTSVSMQRFSITAIASAEGLPAAIGREAVIVDGTQVVRLEILRDDANVSIAAELETAVDEPSKHLRERALALLERYLPFLEGHYRVVDSPHDGRPLWDYRSGKRVDVARADLVSPGAPLMAEGMAALFTLPDNSWAGLSAEPVRFPLKGLFGVGPSVLPALGQEGELLAALSVARLITQTDKPRERMRREMWRKMEV
jgi:glycine/D-amino acid oxidase-like deaminating enzyme